MIVIDMDMPNACNECRAYNETFGHCVLGSLGVPNRYGYDASTKPEWCPIKCDIEDIKAEIEGLQCDSFEVADFSGNRYTYEYLYKADVMAIIDKYISGKEKE